MENENHRYSGPKTVRQSYMSEISVECPKCSKEALVTIDDSWYPNKGRVRCFHCMFTESVSDLIRFNLLVKRNCDNCGKPIDIFIPNQKVKADSITTSCPNCGVTRSFKPRHEAYRLVYVEQGKASDPVFGLPLWFQTQVRGNLFWAYNREHLGEIKNYVRSILREDRPPHILLWLKGSPRSLKKLKTGKQCLKRLTSWKRSK